MASIAQDKASRSPRGAARGLSRLLPVYGMPALMVALIVLFSVILPETFPTRMNLNSILADKSIIALLALAAMIPMLTNKIDLTVGYGIVLWHILTITLQTRFGFSWPLAVALVLVLGLVFGFINGLLVEMAKIDSFIATLGTGTILYAIALWHTGGRQVVGSLPEAFYLINGAQLFGLPASIWYVAGVAVLLWIVTEYLPVGRFLYAIGANPRAAQLNGIPVRRHVIGAFMSSGLLTAFAGVVLASKLGIGQASVGLEFLLPALVGAFLGATTIRPGRVNVWGTLVGVGVLAVGISGIQQCGGAFFIEPLFNGTTLLVAIGIAGYGSRRRAPTTKRVSSGSSAKQD
jgi:ribose transport system permease protein